jgi:holo-[acyl-carrier protein] synthase
MIIGIGMDLIEVTRIARLIERHPKRATERLFTPDECAYCSGSRTPEESYAARFAAKEALLKALGTGWSGGVAWHDVEVVARPSGAPSIRLTGVAQATAARLGVETIHVSLTHTRDLAAAYVVLEGHPKNV